MDVGVLPPGPDAVAGQGELVCGAGPGAAGGGLLAPGAGPGPGADDAEPVGAAAATEAGNPACVNWIANF